MGLGVIKSARPKHTPVVSAGAPSLESRLSKETGTGGVQPRTPPALPQKPKIKERQPRATLQAAPAHSHSLAPRGATHSRRIASRPPHRSPEAHRWQGTTKSLHAVRDH
ncbi:hypothetical protein NDU88_000783 [Pleurodeles waltl]|uniref:Uncharacterized protein n=1 Tax=Pleurodeles waltl TaxID=8319 RepID=A0AAV7Q192_PLEWA|nr:hypothetical protein NDU88_000783 [Pleurodeles waltl]